VTEKLSLGVAARLSTYLRILRQSKKQGIDSISSQEISEHANVNPTQVRRDLSTFGKFGKRGVGYNIDGLIGEIQEILHSEGVHHIALIGAGKLGGAVATSSIFQEHGFHIAAIFDVDPDKIDKRVGELVIQPADDIARVCGDLDVVVGVIAVPPDQAQRSADALVAGRVTIIFNYTETLLAVPEDVTVHTINPAEEMLYALYFYLT
jgi:redox-sensing transcriptional repressor